MDNIWIRERFYIKWTRENFFCTQSMLGVGTNYGGRWFYKFGYLTLASEMGVDEHGPDSFLGFGNDSFYFFWEELQIFPCH
jgi:hypothetical protein